MIALETREFGGGIVRRLFTSANQTFRAGEKLSAEQIMAWPVGNRRALIENRFIEVFPAAPPVASTAAVPKHHEPAASPKRRAPHHPR